MNNNAPSPEIQVEERRSPKFPRWLFIIIPVVLIGIIYVVFVKVFHFGFYSGTYSFQKAVLSAGLENNQPVDIRDKFRPSDMIVCTVTTSGLDGIIGMKWYYGDYLLHEKLGKTINNTISTAIQSNKATILPEGRYHVDIYMGTDKIETVFFDIEVYHPIVSPEISNSDNHKSIETPWFPEVPFAFDEVWQINNQEWKINEVKVVLINETENYVTVVVDTDMEITSSNESQLRATAIPIAQYALENGYIGKAQGLQIDGKKYALDQSIIVVFFNTAKQQVSRLPIPIDELER